MGKPMNYMAVDQYGQTFHALGPAPRKELMNRLGYRSASKMYRDKAEGSSVHVGWVIGPHWCEVYEVRPMERPA